MEETETDKEEIEDLNNTEMMIEMTEEEDLPEIKIEDQEENMTTEDNTTTEKDLMKMIEVIDLITIEIEISEKTKEITEEDMMTTKVEIEVNKVVIEEEREREENVVKDNKEIEIDKIL
jgi:hypothetical protein